MTAVCCAVAALLAVGCGQPPSERTAQPTAHRPHVIRLPHGVWPRFLEVARDGSLWVAESSGDAVARVDRAGRVTQYPTGRTDSDPEDLAEGPDGRMWFTGFQEVDRVRPGGRVSGYSSVGRNPTAAVGESEAIARGPDGALWFTDESVPPRIVRVTTNGRFKSRKIPSGDAGFEMTGIAAGPDGALWFTESSDTRYDPTDGIGRMTVDGVYRRWSLRKRSSYPSRITAGPDGAMWFTERGDHRVGRITMAGDIEEFRVPGRARDGPFDITAGPDGALWFTTERGIGRISTSGQVTLWPIPHARLLDGIAADPRGGFWVGDAKAAVIRHFPAGLQTSRP